MSCGSNVADAWRQVGADLPVVQIRDAAENGDVRAAGGANHAASWLPLETTEEIIDLRPAGCRWLDQLLLDLFSN